MIDTETKEVRTLKLYADHEARKDLGEIEASPASDRKVGITFKIPTGHSFNTEAPNQIRNDKDEIFKVLAPGVVKAATGNYEGEIYYCHDSTKLCLVDKFKFGASSNH